MGGGGGGGGVADPLPFISDGGKGSGVRPIPSFVHARALVTYQLTNQITLQ